MKGAGRAAFIAHRETIAAELEAGWPIKAVYQKLSDSLHISYSQFTRYVHILIRSPGQPAAAAPASAGPALRPAQPVIAPKPAVSTPEERPSRHARHEPVPRTFTYDGNPRQDDKARLIGRREPKG